MINRRQFLLFISALPLLPACTSQLPNCSVAQRDGLERLISYAKAHYSPLPKLHDASVREQLIGSAKSLVSQISFHAGASDEDIRRLIATQSEKDADEGAFSRSGGAMVTRTDMFLMLVSSGSLKETDLASVC